jgi:hypothetical protein
MGSSPSDKSGMVLSGLRLLRTFVLTWFPFVLGAQATAWAQDTVTTPWESVPPAVLSSVASCCRMTPDELIASANLTSRDPLLGYRCAAGSEAVACFRREAEAAASGFSEFKAQFYQELPPPARRILYGPAGCGEVFMGFAPYANCIRQSLRAPRSPLLQAVRAGGGFVPSALRALDRAELKFVLYGASSLACERLVNPGVPPRSPSPDATDPCLRTLPDPGLETVPFRPTASDAVARLAQEAERAARSGGTEEGSESGRPRSLTEPIVNLNPIGIGFTRRECPAYVADMGCVPQSGPYSPQVDAAGVPLSVDAAFPGMRSVLFANLAEHAVELMAQSQISSLLALNPELDPSEARRRKRDFLSAASCLSRDARREVEATFEVVGTPLFTARVREHRSRLGEDLRQTAQLMVQSEQRLSEITPLFANGGRCGLFAYRDLPPAQRRECDRLFAEKRSAERTRDEGFANYPILAEERGGSRVLEQIAAAEKAAAAMRIQDELLSRSLDATESRVREICEDPERGGKLAALNPIIARSYIEQNPYAAWVFCAAFVEIEQNQDLLTASRLAFIGLSLMVTGGWSGLAVGALSAGLTVHELAERHATYTRDREEYLAGVGNVAAYLEAREGLSTFYRDAAFELGLETLGLAPELGLLRAWNRADRLASLGHLSQLPSSARASFTRWYRSRVDSIFGSAATGLSDAQIAALARLEEAGFDLRALARSPACAL